MTQSTDFSPGDIVKLKSGGPDMTVRSHKKDLNGDLTGTYVCQWFAGKKLEKGEFPGDSLEVAEREDKNDGN